MTQRTAKIAPTPRQERDGFAASVLVGLSQQRKSLPCRYFYDSIGSALFEEITRQPEYYLTTAEIAILEANAAQMLEGEDAALVELGSGSSLKTEILLERLPRLCAYVPIDVSQSALDEAALRLRRRFPALAIWPLVQDFSRALELPSQLASQSKIGFFPGSTIGNFTPIEAERLLSKIRRALSPARLLVGVDLKKDARLLHRAYNDAKGVTAAFNLNLLARINRELDGTFDIEAFQHQAIYEPFEGRIEMRLVSLRDQIVRVGCALFCFARGEAIHTENSYKYTIDRFRRTAVSAGWTPRRVWTDENGFFSVHELVSLETQAPDSL
jgi:dimethylhistidine N-methyltransferase